MFLTHEELSELTGKRRRQSQLEALRSMGIQHRIRPDGSLAVLRSHVEKEMGGYEPQDKAEVRVEPNWGAM